MAKNFDAQIQVKDKNSIATLQKIMKETAKLKKDIEKLNSKPIQIKSKTDASFKKVQEDLKKLQNTRINPIQIRANDGLTPIMHRLEGTISNTFRQINSQVGALAPKLAALNAASAGSGAGLLGGAAAGRLLGGRNGGNGNGSGGSKWSFPSLKMPNFSGMLNTIKGLGSSLGSGILNYGPKVATAGANLSWKMFTGFKQGVGKAASKTGSILKPFVDAMDKNSPFMKQGDIQDSYFSQMIEKQKAKIQKLNDSFKRMTGFTRNEHLPKYQQEMVHTGPDDYETMLRRVTPNMFEKIKNGAKSAGSSIRQIFAGNGASVFRSSLASIQTHFHALTSSAGFFGRNLRASFSSLPAMGNTIRTLGTRMAMLGQRGLFAGGHAIATPFAGIARGLMAVPALAGSAFSRISSLGVRAFSSIARVGGSAFRVLGPAVSTVFRGVTAVGGAAFRGVASIGKVALKGVGSVFSMMASGLKTALSAAFRGAAAVGKAALMAAVAAIGVGIHGLAEQESNKVAMKHFIKNGNEGMSDADATKKNDDYFQKLNKLGVDTPFANSDIYSAGRKAVQVSDGDTDKAMDLTKISADMAALNPGKTVQDAMEAMADLKNGETERMKEFGFKISQDDLKMLARGSTGGEALTSEETNKAFTKLTAGDGKIGKTFKGGASELSGTLSGKFSTLTGGFAQMMTDAVEPFSDILKGAMDNMTASFEKIGPALKNAFAGAASFMGDLGKGDSSNFPIIENLTNAFNNLKGAVEPIIDSLMTQFDKISSSAEGSFGGIGGIVEGAADVIADVLKGLTPVLDLLSPAFDAIKNTVIAVWPVVQGIITIGSQIISDAVSFLGPVFDAVGSVMQSIGNIIAEVWPGIQETILNVWANLQPVLDLFSTLAQGVADVFAWAWPGIADVIKTLWSVIGGILEDVSKALGGIAEAAKWAFDKLTEFGKWVSGNGDKIDKAKETNDINPGGGSGDGQPNAWGLKKVPYDGYRAVLHEGERVLTARETRQQDAGQFAMAGGGNYEIHVHEASNPEATAQAVYERLKRAHENRG